MIWKMRSPDAVARCAWPIHIPSARSGMIDHPEVEVEGDERRRARACRARPSARRRAARQPARAAAGTRGAARTIARWRFARNVCPNSASLRRVELRLLRRLLRERLHDVDADDVLLGDRRDVGELLLHVAQRRVRDVAVAVRERDEQRRASRARSNASFHSTEEEDDGHRDTVRTFWKKKIRP